MNAVAAILKSKVAARPADQLIDMANTLNGQTTDESDIVIGFILNELEARMAEADFVAFCETLN